jgi:hypothetical protein
MTKPSHTCNLFPHPFHPLSPSLRPLDGWRFKRPLEPVHWRQRMPSSTSTSTTNSPICRPFADVGAHTALRLHLRIRCRVKRGCQSWHTDHPTDQSALSCLSCIHTHAYAHPMQVVLLTNHWPLWCTVGPRLVVAVRLGLPVWRWCSSLEMVLWGPDCWLWRLDELRLLGRRW